jgi:hypothetical protein
MMTELSYEKRGSPQAPSFACTYRANDTISSTISETRTKFMR